MDNVIGFPDNDKLTIDDLPSCECKGCLDAGMVALEKMMITLREIKNNCPLTNTVN